MAASDHTRQRLVQFHGRRYSLRLEPVFWTALTAAARARQMRLGRLVATLAEEVPTGGNLASHLRVFCLEQTRIAAVQEHERVPRPALAASAANLDVVVDHCPAPCLVVGQDYVIHRVNDAFVRWYGSGRAQLTGQPFGHFFQLRAAQSIGALFRAFGARNRDWAAAELLFVSPSRVVATPVRLVPVGRRSAEDFAVLIMVEEARG